MHEASSNDPASRAFLAGLIALTFLMNVIGRGVSETFAVFLLPVERSLGVERAAMGATYSVYMLAYGIMAPLAGQIIDRRGARICYGGGLLALGIGYILAGASQTIWWYYLCVGVFGGIGASLLGMVAASSLLSRWFTTRLATVSAVPYAAIGAGMLIFPPLTQLAIARFGWRVSYQALGMLALLMLLPLLVLPLGKYAAGAPQWRALQTARSSTTTPSGQWAIRDVLNTRAFWSLFLAYFATSVAAYAVLPHSVAFLVENGFDPLVAAGAFGLNGLMSTMGIIAVGWASDRFGRLLTVTVSYLSTMIGVAALLAIVVWPSMALVYLFVIGFGSMQGARGPILVALVAKIFGGASVGTIYGTLSLALGTGAAFGSLVSGFLHQLTGNYVAAFVVSLAASMTGLLTFWLAPSIRHERLSASQSA